MKKRNPIIALAQIRYFDSYEKNNVEKIKKYIRLAKKKNADIICFPESCIHKLDFLPFDHKLIEEIKKECKKNSIWCIISDDMAIGRKIYNAAILINREGKIEGSYKKIHLYGDNKGVRAGRKIKVFKTDFAKIGIAICWDLAYPKLFKKMKLKGAEIVFCPTYWKYELQAHHARKYEEKHKNREKGTLKSLLMARAFENLFFVALCNPANGEKDLISYSAICSPHKILSDINSKEGLIYSHVDLSEIEKLQKLYDPSRIIN
ncbi:MAG TPA: carbon-nitrogen hydrolase family protein [Candidatus Pacearchaeota archaeon]|nr:carbon-nitrogen hydrolase family protein [Candidatus Pacearchaeota archaeon]